MREANSSNRHAVAAHLELWLPSAIVMTTVAVTYLKGKMGTGFLNFDRVRDTSSHDC
jgi:hypothetical protein